MGDDCEVVTYFHACFMCISLYESVLAELQELV